jgi:hypothetical protein
MATEYVEYDGSDQQYGTEFVDHRVITVADAKASWDVDIPEDLVWSKRRFRGADRLLLKTEDVPASVMEYVLQEPGFKAVTEE